MQDIQQIEREDVSKIEEGKLSDGKYYYLDFSTQTFYGIYVKDSIHNSNSFDSYTACKEWLREQGG